MAQTARTRQQRSRAPQASPETAETSRISPHQPTPVRSSPHHEAITHSIPTPIFVISVKGIRKGDRAKHPNPNPGPGLRPNPHTPRPQSPPAKHLITLGLRLDGTLVQPFCTPPLPCAARAHCCVSARTHSGDPPSRARAARVVSAIGSCHASIPGVFTSPSVVLCV